MQEYLAIWWVLSLHTFGLRIVLDLQKTEGPLERAVLGKAEF